MTKASEPLDGDKFTEGDVLFADRIEDRDASTQNGGVFDGIDILGNTNDSFGTEQHVFCISTITGNTIHCFILTHLEQSTLA